MLAAALTTGALLVLPGAASAAPVITTVLTKDASTPSIDPTSVAKYNVVISTDADTTAAGVINVSPNYTNAWDGAALVSGGAITDTGAVTPTFAADMDANGVDISIPIGLTAADPITVQFDVRLPDRVVDTALGQTGFKVTATSPVLANFNTTALNASSDPIDVYMGDGTKQSKLYVTAGDTTSTPGGLGNWWAPHNSTLTTTFTVHNWGDGSAYNVLMYSSANASDSPVQPRKPKADSPDFDFLTDFEVKTSAVGGDCADYAVTADTNDCLIGEIPAGGSKTVTVYTAGLTHLGMTVRPSASLSNERQFERKRGVNSTPGWNDTNDWSSSVQAARVKVTDGKSVLPRVSVDGPALAAGNTDVTYDVEISNGGTDSITNGLVRVSAPVFDDKGNNVSSAYVGDEKRVASLKSVNIPGLTCGESKNEAYQNWDTGKFETKTRMSVADCSITDLPAGARLVGTVVANFPTLHNDSYVADDPQDRGNAEYGNVNVDVYTAHFDRPGSSTEGGDSTGLNRAASADLDVSVKSAAQIGSERLGLHVVTIKNNGPSVAKRVSLAGSSYKLVGKFESTLLPGSCTGVVRSENLACAIGDIESGQSVSITIPVLGAKKLGTTQVTTYEVDSWERDPNFDNNTVANVQTVVKASLAPLTGVKIAKQPVRNIAQVVKSGLPSTVTCPGKCTVKSTLQVNRKVAERLGLVKAPRKAKAGAKKPLPYIVVGVGTKKLNKAGKVVVVAKFSRNYKVKISKLTKPLTVNRVLTVTSNETLTRGATYMKGQNTVLKPAKAKKAKRPRR